MLRTIIAPRDDYTVHPCSEDSLADIEDLAQLWPGSLYCVPFSLSVLCASPVVADRPQVGSESNSLPTFLTEILATGNIRRILLPRDISVAVSPCHRVQQDCVGERVARPDEASWWGGVSKFQREK